MRQKRIVYSGEVALRVCAAWAAGESLRGMSAEADMPNACTVRAWARERADFRAMWEAARAARAALFEREPGLAQRAAGRLGPRPGIDEAAAAKVCARIAAGESLRALAADRSLPSVQTIYNWLASSEEFRLAYQGACDVRAEALLEEGLEIADDDAADLIEDADGTLRPNPVAVRRARLRLEARKAFAARTAPRRDYGPPAAGAARGPGPARQGDGGEAAPTYEEMLFALLAREAAERAADGAAWNGFVGREGEAFEEWEEG
jgi:hypothetical protein